MKTMLLILACVALVRPARAQTAPAPTSNAVVAVDTLAELAQWVKTQQANIGVGYDLQRVKYVTTSWDLFSWGSYGLDVAAAGAKDYFDFGPMTSVANAAPTRYGGLPLVHFGNIWDAVAGNVPAGVKHHVNLASLPDVSLGLGVLYPHSGRLLDWTWKRDAQAVMVYRFGGAP